MIIIIMSTDPIGPLAPVVLNKRASHLACFGPNQLSYKRASHLACSGPKNKSIEN